MRTLFSVGADVIFKELRHAQTKDEIFRKSTMKTDEYLNENFSDDNEDSGAGAGGELLHGKYDEKTSAALFQQALMQWRTGDVPTSRPIVPNNKKCSTNEAQMDTVYDANGKINPISIPRIEFHSSTLTYGEKLLVKKYRRATKTHNDTNTQPSSVVSRIEIEVIGFVSRDELFS
jgi:hypothetical protein